MSVIRFQGNAIATSPGNTASTSTGDYIVVGDWNYVPSTRAVQINRTTQITLNTSSTVRADLLEDVIVSNMGFFSNNVLGNTADVFLLASTVSPQDALPGVTYGDADATT